MKGMTRIQTKEDVEKICSAKLKEIALRLVMKVVETEELIDATQYSPFKTEFTGRGIGLGIAISKIESAIQDRETFAQYELEKKEILERKKRLAYSADGWNMKMI